MVKELERRELRQEGGQRFPVGAEEASPKNQSEEQVILPSNSWRQIFLNYSSVPPSVPCGPWVLSPPSLVPWWVYSYPIITWPTRDLITSSATSLAEIISQTPFLISFSCLIVAWVIYNAEQFLFL